MKTRNFFGILLAMIFLAGPCLAAPVANFNVYYLNTTNGSTWDNLTTLSATKAQILSFNASAGGATSWTWDFGDGRKGSGQQTTHQYSYPVQKWLVYVNGSAKNVVVLNASDAVSSSYQTKVLNISVSLQPLVMVTQTVALLNESYSQTFIDVIGGNESVQDGWIGIDFLGGLQGAQDVYVSVLGYTVFAILIFSLPFIMNWLISKDFVVAGIIGMFMGIYIIARLPATMKLLAVSFIGLAIVAIIYSLVKERI